MNRTLATLLLTTSLTTALGVISCATPLQAQTRESAQIPFAFHLNSEVMQPGRYEVHSDQYSNPWLFTVSAPNGHSQFLSAFPHGTANPDKPELTFECAGGNCQLTGLSLPGSKVAYGFKRDKSKYRLGLATEIVAVRLNR